MALASLKLVTALRSTAARLRDGSSYQWGHLGMCNCGHLVQTVCALPPQQIHRIALSDREGDWEQLANAYCPASGFAIDDVLRELVALGLSTHEIGHLEWLDEARVLSALPGGHRWLRRNDRADLIEYLETWASLLEAELPASSLAA